MSKTKLFTVGHSNRSIDEFLVLLQTNDISAIADVRSQPYSKYTPHFNRENLKAFLKDGNIEYVFLGEELGARRSESTCYVDQQAKYELIEKTPAFNSGLERIQKGAASHRIAMMCSEKDPLTCHRTILIAKCLRSDFDIQHIISAENLESQDEAEKRLLRLWGMEGHDLFLSADEQLEDAYRRQANEIAYKESDLVSSEEMGETDD